MVWPLTDPSHEIITMYSRGKIRGVRLVRVLARHCRTPTIDGTSNRKRTRIPEACLQRRSSLSGYPSHLADLSHMTHVICSSVSAVSETELPRAFASGAWARPAEPPTANLWYKFGTFQHRVTEGYDVSNSSVLSSTETLNILNGSVQSATYAFGVLNGSVHSMPVIQVQEPGGRYGTIQYRHSRSERDSESAQSGVFHAYYYDIPLPHVPFSHAPTIWLPPTTDTSEVLSLDITW